MVTTDEDRAQFDGLSTPGGVSIRPATADDVPQVAAIFGRAFDDYRAAFGVDAPTLAALWEPSLRARVAHTTVAVLQGGRIAGFCVFVRPGEKEEYGDETTFRERLGAFRRAFGASGFWRLPALFIPMGLTYSHRQTCKDELYISLLGVDPDVQGRGIGQALLAAAATEGRRNGAAAVLLHTASTNLRARAAYARAGYLLESTVRAPWRGPAGIPAYVALRKPLLADPAPRLSRLPGLFAGSD